jgi:outer membrane phospholipase A
MVRASLPAFLLGLGLCLAPLASHAELSLLAPSRTIDPRVPFRLALIVTAESTARSYVLPEVLRVTMTPDLGSAVQVELRREGALPDRLDLRQGEFRRIEYVGEVPPGLRGRVRIDAIDIDAPPMLVQLVQPRENVARDSVAPQTSGSGPAVPEATATAPATTLAVRASDDPNLQDEGRLSFYDPMYFVVGPGIDGNAQFQLSFKLRLYEPRDRSSRRFINNFYLGYTQTSLWDLTSDSKPFLDTSYRPALFYYVPDIGWRVDGRAVGLAAGYEHESNGQDGSDSRNLDSLFVKPYFTFGDPSRFYWTFAPKLYLYLDKTENPDIAKYRGYGDFRFTYGKDDDWQLAASLRKGTQSSAYSIDLQWTYPLARWFDGVAGYLMVQYFNGWGETLLDYNQRESYRFRAGYAISR